MDMAYCIAMVLMFLKVFRMDVIGILNLSSNSFIDGMCVAALAPVVITISWSIFQPRAAMLSINGWYLLVLASSVTGENLSLHYVNSMNCMVIVWSTFVGGCILIW
jgi:hypothetical protein